MAESETRKPRIISAAEFAQGWDTERTTHELKDLEVNVRGTTLYIPFKTKSDMEEVMGGPVSAVKYRTFSDFRVWLTPCAPNDPDARALRPTNDTQSSAQLGFAIPLRKLHVTVPKTRKYTFPLERIEVEGGRVVYEFSFRDFEDERRQVGKQSAQQAPADEPPTEDA